ncbi:hypothetical protein ANN_22464 [Periplaneta americana]|uniref:Uncharacterized protein n=1 Tax=Periplaneta americana TaxID=6978 RepID=A0ABQ8S967_PERAM|nr:hypothetical protein ANN_22464 [Periplaneta americana]
MSFGEMRSRIRHRLPDTCLTVVENLGQAQPGNQPKKESNQCPSTAQDQYYNDKDHDLIEFEPPSSHKEGCFKCCSIVTYSFIKPRKRVYAHHNKVEQDRLLASLMSVSSMKRRHQQKHDFGKLNSLVVKYMDEETKQHYQVEISNRFASLATSDKAEEELDVNSVWENIRDNIKIAAEQSISYHETKKRKPWFDEDCSTVVERRKQAKLKFLQDPIEIIISMKDGKQVYT